MRKFNIEDAGFNVGINVQITKRDKHTGRVIEQRKGHNRCLKMQLMGIVKWLNGEFNDTQPFLVHYDWIPRYLGIGTNTAVGTTVTDVTTHVTTNDTHLLNEISPRLKLPERNKIINKSTQNYIQLVIVTYLPDELYVGQSIGEAGLFSKETGNNCLFRITFEPIIKDTDTVVEVNWTISVISIESTGKPYEELDKSDLQKAMSNLLDRFGELYPSIAKAASDLKDPGIYDYGRTDVTQEQLTTTTTLLNDDYADLKDQSPDEIATMLDEINGVVI